MKFLKDKRITDSNADVLHIDNVDDVKEHYNILLYLCCLQQLTLKTNNIVILKQLAEQVIIDEYGIELVINEFETKGMLITLIRINNEEEIR